MRKLLTPEMSPGKPSGLHADRLAELSVLLSGLQSRVASGQEVSRAWALQPDQLLHGGPSGKRLSCSVSVFSSVKWAQQ